MKQNKQDIKVETPRENPKGREEYYFFPKYRKTIKAISLKEAEKKVKENV